ncbi:LSM domain-containing proteinAD [Phytophthora infestans]|uniref:LSM domain-containing proteinAD n=1 Tax=Phytophthora infestans TaxID=4787 RepID=A0A833T3M6_PHYIN|nr:LSM domain-containing proteinAD [Phytophthora infestans]
MTTSTASTQQPVEEEGGGGLVASGDIGESVQPKEASSQRPTLKPLRRGSLHAPPPLFSSLFHCPMQTTTTRSGGQAASRKNNSAGNGSKGKKKKPQQPKSNGNGKEAAEPAAAGPRPVVPPPLSGPWGNPKPAATSAPPPGFAPSPPKPTSSGFSDGHLRLLRHRALFAFRFLVGKAVELQLVASDDRYVGILDCVDPDDFSVVLKSTKRLSSGQNATPFEDGSTVIFRRQQLAHLVADGSVNYTDGVFAPGAAASGGFRTDMEISGQKGEHLFGRELEAASSWLDPALDTGSLEDPSSNGRRKSHGWNQFEANEKLFGVVSTYDENIYTTKLDKTKISTEQSRAAEKLAQEIERQSAAGNFHLQEERGQAARGGKHANDLDEEARYSSVDRRGAPPNGDAYVPPAMRNAQRQSSGGKSQTKVPVPAPPSEPAPPVGAPAQVPPAAPKPLSFSEAVTGRSAAAAPKEALKSQLDEKKVVAASPKKETPSVQVNGKDAKPAAAKSKGSPKKKDTASGKEKTESKNEPKIESKSTSKTTTTATTKKEETPQATPKKGLNPNAKEFKLNASAAEFTPSFTVPPAVKEHVSSPYRGGSPGHMPYPHPGMGYPPPMQEEWMYDSLGGEEGGEMGMPPYGYGVPMGPNGVPMMYPPMMPQQNMRMMGGQRGGYGYQQPGYNPRSYYSPPHGSFPPYAGVGPQPPLPPTPSGDETPVDNPPAPPVPDTAPEVDATTSNSKQQPSASKKK